MTQDKLNLKLKLAQEKEKLQNHQRNVLLAKTAILLFDIKEAAKQWKRNKIKDLHQT